MRVVGEGVLHQHSHYIRRVQPACGGASIAGEQDCRRIVTQIFDAELAGQLVSGLRYEHYDAALAFDRPKLEG
jgi:hypothetical protein